MNYRQSKWINVTAIIFLIICFTFNMAHSSDIKKRLKVPEEGNQQMLTLTDGSTLVGIITEVGESEVKFKTDLGEMTIAINKITDIKEVSSKAFKGGKYWFPNPNRTRLYFSPTGRMLRKGEAYFSAYYLFFPGINYGITDNITIGGGFSIFPGVDFDKQILFFTPKIGINAASNIDFSISGLIVRIPDPDDDDVFGEDSRSFYIGVVYGMGTIGSEDHSFTFGLGYGYADDEFADKPLVILGGETRISRRIALVTENWLMPGVDDPLVSYGMRFFGEGLSVDLALLNIVGEDTFFPGFPYLGFVYNF